MSVLYASTDSAPAGIGVMPAPIGRGLLVQAETSMFEIPGTQWSQLVEGRAVHTRALDGAKLAQPEEL